MNSWNVEKKSGELKIKIKSNVTDKWSRLLV